MTMIMRPVSDTGGVPLQAAVSLWSKRLVAALKRWLAAFKTWKAERAAIAQLNAMSDRELKDIGLTRPAIEAAVRDEAVRQTMYSRYY